MNCLVDTEQRIELADMAAEAFWSDADLIATLAAIIVVLLKVIALVVAHILAFIALAIAPLASAIFRALSA